MDEQVYFQKQVYPVHFSAISCAPMILFTAKVQYSLSFRSEFIIAWFSKTRDWQSYADNTSRWCAVQEKISHLAVLLLG